MAELNPWLATLGGLFGQATTSTVRLYIMTILLHEDGLKYQELTCF